MRRRSSSGLAATEEGRWGSVGRLWMPCILVSKMAKQTRANILEDPRRCIATCGFGNSLYHPAPSGSLFPALLGEARPTRRRGRRQAAAGCSRPLPSAPELLAAPLRFPVPGHSQRAAAPGFPRFPVPGEHASRGVAGFDCFPGCCRPGCCRSSCRFPPSVTEGAGQSFANNLH